MKLKNVKTWMIVAVLLSFFPTSAYAFYVDGIGYTKYSANTVSVESWDYDNDSQVVIIPETVVYNGVEYTVVAIEAGFKTNAKELYIPKSVTKILTKEQGVYGGYVHSYGYFYESSNLESVSVDSENPVFCSEDGVLFFRDLSSILYYPEKKRNDRYEIPEGVVEIFDRAFEDNEYIKSVKIPNTVKFINMSAFFGCENLSEVEWSSKIEIIATDAFQDTRISTAILPRTLKVIGDDALSSYDVLTVYCYGETPASIMRYKGREQPFSEDTLEKGILYVPKDAKNAYMRAEAWREFHVIEEFDVPSDDPTAEEKDCTITYLNIDGNSMTESKITLSLPVPEVVEGYTFDKWVVLEGDLKAGIRIQATYTKDTETSVDDLSETSNSSKNYTHKIIRKGQIFIYKDGELYNTTGI